MTTQHWSIKRRRGSILLGVFIGLVFVSGRADRVSASLSQQATENEDNLVVEKLISLSSDHSGATIDCGKTDEFKPDARVTNCVLAASAQRKPFYVFYSGLATPFLRSAYGLAGDSKLNVYEVEYDSRGLLNLALGKRAQVFDDNRVRVTTCFRPVRLVKAKEGMPVCVTPINTQESERAAQQSPIETTVCAILDHPTAFNNKMVRVHGYASGNFEYSNLDGDECSGSLWFEYGHEEGPPDLIATVGGGARPGAEDAEGRWIMPIPVKLIQDASFGRFQRLMTKRAELDAGDMKENPNDSEFHRVAATFIGRIDGVSDDVRAFHLKRKATDRADYLGFGQMGLFDAELVVQRVENDAVLDPPAAIQKRLDP